MAEHYDIHATITRAQRMTYAEQAEYKDSYYYGQSLWYSWGWLDATPQDKREHLNLDDGYTFALVMAILRVRYEKEELYSMPSIIGAWETYRDIVVPERKRIAQWAQVTA